MASVTFLTFYIDYSVGVYVLSSILQNAGHDVSVIFFKLNAREKISWFKENPVNIEEVDAYGNIIGTNSDVNTWTEQETDLLIEKINELSPDLLCISSRSPHKEIILDVIPKVREKCNVKMIAGGFGPTLDPELYADIVDYVYLGEAENTILEIASLIENDKSLDDMDNICYKKNGRLIKNKLRQPEINQFRYQQIPVKFFYIENNRSYSFNERKNIIKTHTYSTFFGRGCISTCSYCSAGQWQKIYGKEGIKIKKRRNRQIEDVIDELKSIKDKGYTFVLFRDEFLCADIDTLKLFFKRYEYEIGIPFWAYLVPAQILEHPELLKMAVDAGFVDTEIGFQSGSDIINRKIFTRYISNKRTADYTKLLTQYDINMKFDFIIFNPAETMEDIKATFKLLQHLPKKRSYLALGRLKYFPVSPIIDILKDYQHIKNDFSYYYSVALLYLLCFILPEKEFDQILNDEHLLSSWQRLRDKYQAYLKNNGIEFQVGTHDIPDSITTHRYERILEKNHYNRIIIWGDSTYYKDMSHIFNPSSIQYIIADQDSENFEGISVVSPDILKHIEDDIPIFICSPRKQDIMMNIYNHYPDYKGKIYV